MQKITLKSGRSLDFNYCNLGDLMEFTGIIGNYLGKYVTDVKLDMSNMEACFADLVRQGSMILIPVVLQILGDRNNFTYINNLFKTCVYDGDRLSLASFDKVENREDLIEVTVQVLKLNYGVFINLHHTDSGEK